MEIAKRSRRLRANTSIRRLVKETELSIDDFIYPLFIVEGKNVEREIPSMPDVFHYSSDRAVLEVEKLMKLGIPGVLLFGIPDTKDCVGSEAYNESGVVQNAIREIKAAFPEMLVAADVCLCEYTDHGHCGVIENEKIINDKSVELLVRSAQSLAASGADMIAPSDMMDGRVGAIRTGLDSQGFQDKIIMSYSVKYASAFYGPFRDAAGSAPSFGDRKTYQMDYRGTKEAMREIEADIAEGADIIMVKPAGYYLDIIKEAASRFDYPIAAYNVSGEYCMIKAAARMGWIDEERAALEALTGIKRAGADIIISYYAKSVASWLKK